MGSATLAAYGFGRFVLHLDRGALLADGTECALRPKSLALLRHFVENPGRVIGRDEIMEALWPGVIVTDASIAQCVKDIRRALGANDQSVLRTLSRRGYVFTAEVHRAEAVAAPRIGPAGAAPPGKPAIAVLPFQNMSGDPGKQYFADGIVEEITTALSQIPWLDVAARNSSFAYRGDGADIRRIGRELGVRYVLEGSIRSAGGRVRVIAQLIEAETDAHLWADRFDGALDEGFDLQEQVAIGVAAAVEPIMQVAELRRAAERPMAELTAHDLYLRASAPFLSYDKEQLQEAIALLREAMARDRDYGPAFGLAANFLLQIEVNGWSSDPTADARLAVDYARHALRLMASAASAWLCSGWTRLWLGTPDLAIEHFETSLRLNPRGRRATQMTGIGIAHLFSGRVDEAALRLRESLQDLRSFAWTYRALAACYVLCARPMTPWQPCGNYRASL
jgi:TolB-like protein